MWERLWERHQPVGFFSILVGILTVAPIYLVPLVTVPNLVLYLALAAQGLAWVVFICAVSPARYAAAPRLASELSDLPGSPRMDVTVQLFVNRTPYGEDLGEMMVVEDWLIFEGERTRFSLGPHDVVELRRRAHVWNRPAIDLRLAGLGADVRVKIISVDPHRNPGEMLASWAAGEVRHSAISVLPPLTPMKDWRTYLRPPDKSDDVGPASCLMFAASIVAAYLALTVSRPDPRTVLYAIPAVTAVCFSWVLTDLPVTRRKAAALLKRAVECLPPGAAPIIAGIGDERAPAVSRLDRV